jgi:hypothetical protein
VSGVPVARHGPAPAVFMPLMGGDLFFWFV